MFSCIAISIASNSSTFPFAIKFNKFHHRLRQPLAASPSSIHYDSLRVLKWDKLCDLVASFATTSLGREAVKVQLWSLNQTYDNSLRLLNETNAAVEMHKHGGCILDFGHIDAALVNLKAAIEEDTDWYSRFMPLTEVITNFVINRSLVRMIEQVIDENGSVKDSAVTILEQDPCSPVPVDFFVAQKTRVLIITGPNTGGKTICLKIVGLATMMAKSGSYALYASYCKGMWGNGMFRKWLYLSKVYSLAKDLA